MKKVVLGVAALGLMFSAAVAAFASPQKADIPTLETDGVKFSAGKYEFNRPGVNHGAFEWKGRLTDALSEDRHNVYVEVKIHGHDWVRYYGKQGGSVRLHKSNWDGAQRYTGKARLRVCRDRGSLRPDNCAPVKVLSYNWDR
ncbi:hypothetical protein JCM4814A_65440 [Streptomyces phaeofaciens JCM 4814]|uniref:Secreted protein n=1 Tax=Streptomyces phaeofaciens TaxID=68254 RepID=A0A918LYF1_9ACTN|nr:hypothetical protein [Streptomyces phaeofaciens]GGT75927.1 hypothetical protein GCM10010226_62490 [Streptomyces phaeofaciens]